MLPILGNFLITEWIWSITTASLYIPINILLLFLLLKLWDNLGWVRALSLSIFLTIGSFLLFFSTIYYAGIKLLGIQFVLPEDTYSGSYNILNSSLVLAGIYSAFQVLLLFVIDKFTSIRFWTAFLCVITSNILAAFLVYKLTFNLS
ncbi:MAG: hypothetical protein AMXMBFR12_01350 [Candidatus Babeliales bacterium]